MEIAEQVLGFFQGGVRWGIEPAEMAGFFHARRLEQEDGFGEVDTVHFRDLEFLAASVIRLAPEAQATTRCGASGPARALVGGGTGNFPDQKGVDATAGIEGGRAGEAGVDHGADAGDGERGFRDVGGDNDPGFFRRTDRAFLVGGREGGVKRENIVAPAGGGVFQQLDGAADLVGAGKEDEDIAAIRHRQRLPRERGGLFPDGCLALRTGLAMVRCGFVRAVQDFHGKGPSSGAELRDGSHVIRQRACLQRGRHHDHPQVGAFALLQVQATRQRDVHREPALVELIEDHRRNPGESWIIVQHALEDAIGDIEDFRLRGLLGIETHRVADILPERRPPVFRHETRQQTRRHPPRLDHHHAPRDLRQIRQHPRDFR